MLKDRIEIKVLDINLKRFRDNQQEAVTTPPTIPTYQEEPLIVGF